MERNRVPAALSRTVGGPEEPGLTESSGQQLQQPAHCTRTGTLDTVSFGEWSHPRHKEDRVAVTSQHQAALPSATHVRFYW